MRAPKQKTHISQITVKNTVAQQQGKLTGAQWHSMNGHWVMCRLAVMLCSRQRAHNGPTLGEAPDLTLAMLGRAVVDATKVSNMSHWLFHQVVDKYSLNSGKGANPSVLPLFNLPPTHLGRKSGEFVENVILQKVRGGARAGSCFLLLLLPSFFPSIPPLSPSPLQCPETARPRIKPRSAPRSTARIPAANMHRENDAVHWKTRAAGSPRRTGRLISDPDSRTRQQREGDNAITVTNSANPNSLGDHGLKQIGPERGQMKPDIIICQLQHRTDRIWVISQSKPNWNVKNIQSHPPFP